MLRKGYGSVTEWVVIVVDLRSSIVHRTTECKTAVDGECVARLGTL